MSSTTFHVDSFQVAVGPGISVRWGGADVAVQGYVACFGGDQRFTVYFLSDMAGAPAAAFSEADGVAGVFAPLDALPAYLELLRRCQPVQERLSQRERRREASEAKAGARSGGQLRRSVPGRTLQAKRGPRDAADAPTRSPQQPRGCDRRSKPTPAATIPNGAA